LTSAPLAGWHGPLACRVVLRLGTRHDAGAAAREAFGLTSDVAYLAGMLSTGASIAVWTASSRMGNAPGDKADRWGIYAGLWGARLHGPLARHQGRRDQLRALQNGPRPRARPAAAVTRLPILMPAPRCSDPWRRSPRTSSTAEEEP
jgi:hypothetical protein